MQSKMTEKEFRAMVSRPYSGRPAIEVSADLINHAVFCAREAGLEFAPEPLPVPESLAFAGGGLVPGGIAPDGKSGTLGSWAYPPEPHRDAALRLAAARYNAYPGLRVAADALLRRIETHLAPGTQAYVREQMLALADELAKGPK